MILSIILVLFGALLFGCMMDPTVERDNQRERVLYPQFSCYNDGAYRFKAGRAYRTLALVFRGVAS